MEPCTPHPHHCWCRVIPFIGAIGAGIAITIFAITKWKNLSEVFCRMIKRDAK